MPTDSTARAKWGAGKPRPTGWVWDDVKEYQANLSTDPTPKGWETLWVKFRADKPTAFLRTITAEKRTADEITALCKVTYHTGETEPCSN